MNIFNRTLLKNIFIICSLIVAPNLLAKNSCKTKCYRHNMQLQLSDSLGFPVPDTEFWITLDIMKMGPLVFIQLPLINFQTGPVANAPKEVPYLPPLVPGGYLYTTDGYLPEELRPTDLVPRAIVAASNNGISPVFSFTQAVDTLPNPPAGYIVSVTNAGALAIECAGTFGNIIPTGPQILMPANISYLVTAKKKLCKNVILSDGFTDTTQFIDSAAQDSGFRDSHVNDAFDGTFAWAWADNSMVADKTNGTMNLVAAIGHLNKKGKLKVSDPIQLTDLEPGIMAWDTAIAINRTDKKNIVASYGHIDNNTGESLLYRAVSFDGGKTWPTNGPLNVQPTDGFGDARGVSCDKFGNFWYSATSFEAEFDPAVFYVSSDKGVTFELVFTAPTPIGDQFYDYPQFCFGGDGQGNYGLIFQCTLFNKITRDQTPTVGFIPVTGLGSFGSTTFITLDGLQNSSTESDVTASADGRIWLQGIPNFAGAYTFVSPINLMFKSPGALDENYAGAWHTVILDDNEFGYNDSDTASQPDKGYIFHSTQSILYDEGRQALYAITAEQVPDRSQNMRIFFIISRDNGQTWSNPIDISNCGLKNRGFQSMALDEVTGDLIFGWYDGRNGNLKTVEYFAAAIPAKKLDKMVNAIPLSNPTYTVPSVA